MSRRMRETRLTVVGDFGGGAGAVNLEESDGTGESVGLLSVVHVAHLESCE